MYSHQPEGYVCPFCGLVAGREDGFNTLTDIVYKDQYVTAFIAGKGWPNNLGHVIVIPNEHSENIYDTPDGNISQVYSVAKKMAVALKDAYNCDGISTRQHNEPAGGQNVFHFHVHVFPRYEDDELYANDNDRMDLSPSQRAQYAAKVREALKRTLV